jgi:hypothetical protein
MAKKLLIPVVGVIVLLCIVIATRPDTYSVERSIVMSAPAKVPFALVADFNQWPQWSPWEKLDPAMKKEIGGEPRKAGHTYHWSSTKDDVGEGRMTIEEAPEFEKIAIKLEFIKPWQATNPTTFTFAPEGTGTKVVWRMDGTHNFMSKAMSLAMSMDAMVGKDFEKGLAEMKTVSEAEAAKATAQPAPPPATPPADVAVAVAPPAAATPQDAPVAPGGTAVPAAATPAAP